MQMQNLDKGWLLFYLHLSDCTSIVDQIFRNLATYDFLRTYLIQQVKTHHGYYLQDSVNHLLGICAKTAIGFAPCDDSQQMLPTKLIEKAFLESYNADIAPIIFRPAKLGHDNVSAVFHSFKHPAFIYTPSNTRNTKSILGELRDTSKLIFTLKDKFKHNVRLNNRFFKNYKYEFFYEKKSRKT